MEFSGCHKVQISKQSGLYLAHASIKKMSIFQTVVHLLHLCQNPPQTPLPRAHHGLHAWPPATTFTDMFTVTWSLMMHTCWSLYLHPTWTDVDLHLTLPRLDCLHFASLVLTFLTMRLIYCCLHVAWPFACPWPYLWFAFWICLCALLIKTPRKI